MMSIVLATLVGRFSALPPPEGKTATFPKAISTFDVHSGNLQFAGETNPDNGPDYSQRIRFGA
jgi:hypothetical protein